MAKKRSPKAKLVTYFEQVPLATVKVPADGVARKPKPTVSRRIPVGR